MLISTYMVMIIINYQNRINISTPYIKFNHVSEFIQILQVNFLGKRKKRKCKPIADNKRDYFAFIRRILYLCIIFT